MATQVSGVNRWLILNSNPLNFAQGQENPDAQVEENRSALFRITSEAPDDLQIQIDGSVLETERYGSWYWRPMEYAGVYEVTILLRGRPIARTQVRVFPVKVSQAAREKMFKDISQISSDLLFTLKSPASEMVELRRSSRPRSALTEFELMKMFMAELSVVMPQIRRSPHRMLGSYTEVRNLHEVAVFAGKVLPIPGEAVQVGNLWGNRNGELSYLPQRWEVERSEPTYDVPENRLLKLFLWRQLLPRLYQIQEHAQLELHRQQENLAFKQARNWDGDEAHQISALQQAIEECAALIRHCTAWAESPFLRTVGWQKAESRPTSVLQKHPYYSRFYRLFTQFQSQLRYTSSTERQISKLATRKMSQLYEFWAVFVMTKLIIDLLLRNGYEIASSNGFYELQDDQFQFDVKRDAAIELRGHNQDVVIRYDPVYPPQRDVDSGIVAKYGRQLTPDLAIEVWKKNTAQRVVIFDAKYRVRIDGERRAVEDEVLDKMGRYQREICWKSSDPLSRLERIVSSSYALYPGNELENDTEYLEIGAFPLVPGMSLQKEHRLVVAALLANADILKASRSSDGKQ